MNFYIFLGIVVQIIIAKVSRILSAAFGFLITTGLLIWGLGVYDNGDEIALFGIISLSQPIFIIACIVWYIFDTTETVKAVQEEQAVKRMIDGPLLSDEKVNSFYKTTQQVWRSGALSKLNARFVKEGNMPYKKFVKKYLPFEGSALDTFFKEYEPLENEYLVGLGNLPKDIILGWFVLTNYRLIQRNGSNNEFKEIVLADIDSYKTEGTVAKNLVFTMKSGETIVFENVKMAPAAVYLSAFVPAQPLTAQIF